MLRIWQAKDIKNKHYQWWNSQTNVFFTESRKLLWEKLLLPSRRSVWEVSVGSCRLCLSRLIALQNISVLSGTKRYKKKKKASKLMKTHCVKKSDVKNNSTAKHGASKGNCSFVSSQKGEKSNLKLSRFAHSYSFTSITQFQNNPQAHSCSLQSRVLGHVDNWILSPTFSGVSVFGWRQRGREWGGSRRSRDEVRDGCREG